MAATPSVNENATTFTPGPWETTEISSGIAITATLMNRVGTPTIVLAEVFEDIDIHDANANARLIAAAPRLLDALRGLVGLIQLIQAREPDLQMNHRYVEALAALAEAEGVNPLQA